jgi:hypothetical protein
MNKTMMKINKGMILGIAQGMTMEQEGNRITTQVTTKALIAHVRGSLF